MTAIYQSNTAYLVAMHRRAARAVPSSY